MLFKLTCLSVQKLLSVVLQFVHSQINVPRVTLAKASALDSVNVKVCEDNDSKWFAEGDGSMS